MLICIKPEELDKEFVDYWKLGYIKRTHLDYATNALHAWLEDPITNESEEIIIFRFKKYGFIHDNRSNTYEISVGKAGIMIEIIKNEYEEGV